MGSNRSLRQNLTVSLFTALFIGSLAMPAAAQLVRGRVIDAGTRNAVVGAYIVLIDEAGGRHNGVLTNDLGVYTLRLRQPGRFLVRAEMIGRQSIDSDYMDIGPADTLAIDLTLPLAPITLDEIDVSAAKKCEVRPGSGGETHTVWEEARKALTLEAATRAGNAYRFNIERFERELDNRKRVVAERSSYVSRYTGDPFSAKPAGHLADLGYHEERPDGHFLYGPNAEVLLSDPFLDNHCMFLLRDREKPGQIALAFEPVPGRRVTDIRGELWLDENTAELRSLEFRYTNIPGSMPVGEYGGEATFQRLPSGAWIVRTWGIRSPIVRLVQSNLRGQQIRNEQQTGFYVEGAEVLLILDRLGNVVEETPRAVLAGIVWDSIGDAPLPGAVVYLVETGFADTTDTSGRFRLTGLPEGIYPVSWRHAITESRGYVPDSRDVDLRRGEVSQLDFALTRDVFRTMTAAEMARLDSIVALGKALGRYDWAAQLELAPDRTVRDFTGPPGQIRGIVVSHETDRPIQGVRVTIRGTEYEAFTGLDGKFVIRDVKRGEYEILTEHPGYGSQTNRLAVDAAMIDVTLRLARREAGLRPVRLGARRAPVNPAGDPARAFGTVLDKETGKAGPGVALPITGTPLRQQTEGPRTSTR